MFRFGAPFAVFLIAISIPFYGHSAESYLGLPKTTYHPGYLLAQVTEDDSFDPFSDYSEFDEATEEEADINFFRNGRFLTIGFLIGYKGFTDALATDYQSGGTYGLYLSYFFDMRFAIQFGFSTGDYGFVFSTPSKQTMVGTVAFSIVSINAKYYLNTQNVTKGLADLNPYFITGVSDYFRTYTLTSSQTGTVSNAQESAWGLDVGAGIEIPMMKKKAYFGVQAVFHYVTFPDSNSPVYLSDFSQNSTLTQAGYQYDIMGLVGVNF